MDIKLTYRFFSIVLLLILISACTKSEMRAKKLANHDKWIFTEHRIGSLSIDQFPKWEITNSPVNNEFVQAKWKHHNGSTCLFKWRFDSYSGTFEFLVDHAVEQDEEAKAYLQCSNLSGTYIVLKEKSNLFEFESTDANGYPDLTVFIQIQPM